MTKKIKKSLSLNIPKIPSLLKSEVEFFRIRNNISNGVCCARCLKAHIISKACENELPSRVIKKITDAFNGEEAGHNGYYMDGERLVKICE